ncbi:MAG: acyltransferase, partial [Duodenibacillus sp.]|nr:acyltransferase [Duodenibacillus sp.]
MLMTETEEEKQQTFRERIPELDGLRVLMIFVVSAYHIWQQSWWTPQIFGFSPDPYLRSGYIWVDGTILLSAFLLFLPYVRRKQAGAALPAQADFYKRRARRILPAYYFLILLVFFGICLPWKLYYSPQYMVKDLATHLTFIFPFFRDTYTDTPLGAAAWTLAIEVQFYLIFPLLAKAALKHPGRTLVSMVLVSWGFRLWCLWSLSRYTMVVNQMVSFLDVYALGMAMALLYPRLKELPNRGKAGIVTGIAALAVFILSFWGLLSMLRIQAASGTYTAQQGWAGLLAQWLRSPAPEDNYAVIQRNQMV